MRSNNTMRSTDVRYIHNVDSKEKPLYYGDLEEGDWFYLDGNILICKRHGLYESHGWEGYQAVRPSTGCSFKVKDKDVVKLVDKAEIKHYYKQ